MEAVAIPPFERFYEEHRVVVFRRLTRLLGRQAAEDAFQETFLRALRAYPRLRDSENLRGRVMAIAATVAVDARRRVGARHLPDLLRPRAGARGRDAGEAVRRACSPLPAPRRRHPPPARRVLRGPPEGLRPARRPQPRARLRPSRLDRAPARSV